MAKIQNVYCYKCLKRIGYTDTETKKIKTLCPVCIYSTIFLDLEMLEVYQ